MSKLIINGPIAIECETGKVSDGFHSFDELYDHRCLLFLGLQALVHQGTQPYSGVWKSRRHHDDTAFEGWFIAGLTLPQGQITYHIPDKFWDQRIACEAVNGFPIDRLVERPASGGDRGYQEFRRLFNSHCSSEGGTTLRRKRRARSRTMSQIAAVIPAAIGNCVNARPGPKYLV